MYSLEVDREITEEVEVKHCPNCRIDYDPDCAGTPIDVFYDTGAYTENNFHMKCRDCKMRGPTADTEGEALDKWNNLPRRGGSLKKPEGEL